jgi:lipopolysaccharide transport system ATP-binding protein
MTPIIKVENLGKQYRIGARQASYATLRESLVETVRTPFKQRRAAENMIWALRDVSFEISPGEVVGVIGRNGAGKSTLLKILSQIVEPTEGGADIYGRLSSLLEVGTGFHPELTGRENIYLNGTIMGMKRAEIKRKFDEIVAFAEVEKFVDTPVKRYSSGMYVRLAFAIAAYLDTDTLLVDEVLAVGDAAFQKKCLGAMKSLGTDGRTVLFVSHNMTAIENLCQRVIWLDDGQMCGDGQSSELIVDYLTEYVSDAAVVNLGDFRDRSGNGAVQVVRVELLDEKEQPCSTVRMGHPFRIRIALRSEHYRGNVVVGAELFTEDGLMVADFRSNHVGFDVGCVDGMASYDLVIDQLLLYPRTYILSPWVTDTYVREVFDWVKYAVKFTVESSDFLGTGAYLHSGYGITHIDSRWERV